MKLFDIAAIKNSNVFAKNGLLKILMTKEIEFIAQQIYTALDAMGETLVINPTLEGRRPPRTHITWKEFSIGKDGKIAPDVKNLKDMMVLTLALDMHWSHLFDQYTVELNTALKAVDDNWGNSQFQLAINGVFSQLQATGQYAHIEHQLPHILYHDGDHPNISALYIWYIATQNRRKDHREEKNNFYPELEVVASTAFLYHDVFQTAQYAADQVGLIEMQSSQLYAEHIRTGLNRVREELEPFKDIQDNDKKEYDKAIQALENYSSLVPYIAWKLISPATTMIKSIDGQPTVNTVVEWVCKPALAKIVIKNSQGTTLKPAIDTPLSAVANWIGAIDSNFAGFESTLGAGYANFVLPADLITRSDIPEEVRETIPFISKPFSPQTRVEKTPTTPTTPMTPLSGKERSTINKAGMLYGNHLRVFPEIHVQFKAMLSLAKFPNPNAKPEDTNKSISGNSLWILIFQKMKAGNYDEAAILLKLPVLEAVELPGKPKLEAGQTLFDIFIICINSDINFAMGQSPESYVAIDDQLKIVTTAYANYTFKLPELDTNVWLDQAQRLKDLKDDYPAAKDQQAKTMIEKIIKMIFFLAANPPNVFEKNANMSEESIRKEIERIRAQNEKRREGYQNSKRLLMRSKQQQTLLLMMNPGALMQSGSLPASSLSSASSSSSSKPRLPNAGMSDSIPAFFGSVLQKSQRQLHAASDEQKLIAAGQVDDHQITKLLQEQRRYAQSPAGRSEKQNNGHSASAIVAASIGSDSTLHLASAIVTASPSSDATSESTSSTTTSITLGSSNQ